MGSKVRRPVREPRGDSDGRTRAVPSSVRRRGAALVIRIRGFNGDGGSDEDGRLRMGAGARLSLLLATVAVLLAATIVANTMWPVILRDHPLLLPALDGRNRYLLLSSAKVGAVPLIVVGVGRRLAGHIVYYLLGHWYGEAALHWATRRSRLWRRVARYRRILARIAEAAVLLSSSNIARTLAGATGMSAVRFVIFETVGTTLQMIALLVFVRSTGDRVPRAVGLLDSNASWLTMLLVSLCLGWLLWRVARVRGRRLRPPGTGPRQPSDHHPGGDADRGDA
jgi:membrane protein DedA with SNARE-associated domain